jgi:quercetin 2,3-dioxygenase
MKIEIMPEGSQADGQFNRGEILEKRPVVLSSENQGFKPYSNLFYWAHAWSDSGSTIGEHPHQGFEILSFVLEGSIEHYDSAHEGWKKLSAGDMQIIRSGSGISHSERLLPGSQMFQIWFDPGLQSSIQRPATYNDYKATEFKENKKDEYSELTYLGTNSPVDMNTPGIKIRKMKLDNGNHNIEFNNEDVISVFVLDGELSFDENVLVKGDFVRLSDANNWSVGTKNNTELFIIESPLVPGYKTYSSMYVDA